MLGAVMAVAAISTLHGQVTGVLPAASIACALFVSAIALALVFGESLEPGVQLALLVAAAVTLAVVATRAARARSARAET